MQKYFRLSSLLIFSLSICALIGLSEPLWDQDEAAYFGFGSNMIHTKHWVVPDYPLSEPHRMTPLHFWTSGLFMKVLGISHFSFRLANTIYFLLCGILIYAFSMSLNASSLTLSYKQKKEISFRATVIFFSSIFLMIYQRLALTDIGLLFYSLLGLYSFWKVISFPSLSNNEKNSFQHSALLWVPVFWLALSLGVLQKGPPILILLGGVFICFLLLSKNRSLLIRFHAWGFLPISLLPLLIWGRLAWLATDGALIRWMVDWYILKRTSGSVFGQSGPPGYYLVLFGCFLFPWSLYLPQVVVSLKGKVLDFLNGDEERRDQNIFLLSWVFSGWIFYEFLPSKLPSYSLAVYPLLCIWLAEIWTINNSSSKSVIKPFSENAAVNLNPVSTISKMKNFVPEWNTALIILIGMVWIGIFAYLVLPNKNSFSVSEHFAELKNWESNIQITGLVLVVISLAYTIIQISKRNKENNFLKIALGMLAFHFAFALIYYPSISNKRDYGSKLAELFLEVESFSKQDTFESSIKNPADGETIIIHPEILLPSIITALDERGIDIERILIPKGAQEIIQEINSRRAIYLTPQSFIDVIQFIGFRPASKCLEFYSYESGKNLNLCWFRND